MVRQSGSKWPQRWIFIPYPSNSHETHGERHYKLTDETELVYLVKCRFINYNNQVITFVPRFVSPAPIKNGDYEPHNGVQAKSTGQKVVGPLSNHVTPFILLFCASLMDVSGSLSILLLGCNHATKQVNNSIVTASQATTRPVIPRPPTLR